MTNAFQREDRPTVVPRIITLCVADQAEFIKSVFGASGEVQASRPTELRIGDSVIMVSDGGGVREAMPAFLHVYVPAVDDAYRQATELGATALEEPAMMPWGDRLATIRDPWNNIWQLATRGEVTRA